MVQLQRSHASFHFQLRLSARSSEGPPFMTQTQLRRNLEAFRISPVCSIHSLTSSDLAPTAQASPCFPGRDIVGEQSSAISTRLSSPQLQAKQISQGCVTLFQTRKVVYPSPFPLSH